MPRDRFAFTVMVCRKNHFSGFLSNALKLINHFLLLFDDLIFGFEIALNVDGVFIALGQIANVSYRSTHKNTPCRGISQSSSPLPAILQLLISYSKRINTPEA
jgi:hypothetical protein